MTLNFLALSIPHRRSLNKVSVLVKAETDAKILLISLQFQCDQTLLFSAKPANFEDP